MKGPMKVLKKTKWRKDACLMLSRFLKEFAMNTDVVDLLTTRMYYFE